MRPTSSTAASTSPTPNRSPAAATRATMPSSSRCSRWSGPTTTRERGRGRARAAPGPGARARPRAREPHARRRPRARPRRARAAHDPRGRARAGAGRPARRPRRPRTARGGLHRPAGRGARAAGARGGGPSAGGGPPPARRYRGAHVERVELLQEGVVGLLRALDGFDPERGTPFWAYASWWVRQAMQQLVAELGRPVTMSDRALRNLARLHDAHRAAVADGRGEPTRALLAERTGLTLEQVDELLAVDRAPRSLEEPVSEDERIGTLGELVADPLAEGDYEA